MNTLALKDRVKHSVTFERFQNNELWYICDDGFQFPVPVSDTGTAVFHRCDKGPFFMRWIRKHMEMIAQARSEYEQEA